MKRNAAQAPLTPPSSSPKISRTLAPRRQKVFSSRPSPTLERPAEGSPCPFRIPTGAAAERSTEQPLERGKSKKWSGTQALRDQEQKHPKHQHTAGETTRPSNGERKDASRNGRQGSSVDTCRDRKPDAAEHVHEAAVDDDAIAGVEILAEQGDTLVHWGTYTFECHSRCLAAGSSYLACMLSTASVSEGRKAVRLEQESSLPALSLLLKILHVPASKAVKLPEKVSSEHLWGLSFYCSKFDAVDAAKPHVARWLTALGCPLDNLYTATSDPRRIENRFTTAYTFGIRSETHAWLRVLAINTRFDVEREAVTFGDGTLLGSTVVRNAIPLIQKYRQELLADVLHVLMSYLNWLLGVQRNETRQRSRQSLVPEYACFGFMVRKLSESQLYPVPSVHNMTMSLKEIYGVLEDIIKTVRDEGKAFVDMHAKAGLEECLDDLLDLFERDMPIEIKLEEE